MRLIRAKRSCELPGRGCIDRRTTDRTRPDHS
jgi:hypothetical protein